MSKHPFAANSITRYNREQTWTDWAPAMRRVQYSRPWFPAHTTARKYPLVLFSITRARIK